MEKVVNRINDYLIRPLASLAKVAIRSRKPSSTNKEEHRPLVIMGNGPSLRSYLDDADNLREGFDLMAVNFAAITEEFVQIKPEMYIIADPHFVKGLGTDDKVAMLWNALDDVTWPMTLWLPLSLRKLTYVLRETLPDNVSVRWYNLTPVEGKGALTRFLIGHGLGMPRPRNVMIPAIMTALRSGYRKIFLVGADHTWSRSLWVDDENRVVSVQPHFYKDNEEETRRVASEYAGYHLHDILQSLTIAFRSYFDIKEYADSIGAEIINATPGSFIDAFPRCGYGQMRKLSRP